MWGTARRLNPRNAIAPRQPIGSSPRFAASGSIAVPVCSRGSVARIALLAALTTGTLLALPASTASAGEDCGGVPIVEQVCDVGIEAADLPDTALDTVGGAAGDLAQSAGKGILELIRDAIVGAAVWFLQQIAGLIDATTDVHLTSVSACVDPSNSLTGTLGSAASHTSDDCYRPVSWFGERYAAMWGMATLFALLIVLFIVIDAVGRGDAGLLWKAALIRLPLAFVFTGGALALTGMLLELTDAMSAGVTSAVSKDAGDFFSAVVEGSSAAGAGAGASGGGVGGVLAGAGAVPGFVAIVGSLVMVVGALFVWLELIVRAASIFIVVFFLPFAFMAMIWPRTQGVLKRSIELLGVLIFSKFVIVAILALGAAALGNASADAAGFGQVLG